MYGNPPFCYGFEGEGGMEEDSDWLASEPPGQLAWVSAEEAVCDCCCEASSIPLPPAGHSSLLLAGSKSIFLLACFTGSEVYI